MNCSREDIRIRYEIYSKCDRMVHVGILLYRYIVRKDVTQQRVEGMTIDAYA